MVLLGAIHCSEFSCLAPCVLIRRDLCLEVMTLVGGFWIWELILCSTVIPVNTCT